jgi:IS30 family transposase
MKCSRTAVRKEILRGLIEKPQSTVTKSPILVYSPQASEYKHDKKIKQLKHRTLKILEHPKLQAFVTTCIANRYSLKTIAGCLYFRKEDVETKISSKTLYNYVDDERVAFINRHVLIHPPKRKQRHKPHGKRMNGPSIEERSNRINNRKTFGHFEGDLIEGKRGTNCHLFTLCERLSRFGIAFKIHSKTPEAVVKAMKRLQLDKILNFGVNIKTLTLDNGIEFWEWSKMSTSIITGLCAIDVFFCHPYSSFEKGTVENFNGIVRRKYDKGTDFTNISQEEIDKEVKWINCYPRSIHKYKTALEMYNQYVQN